MSFDKEMKATKLAMQEYTTEFKELAAGLVKEVLTESRAPSVIPRAYMGDYVVAAGKAPFILETEQRLETAVPVAGDIDPQWSFVAAPSCR